MLFGAANGVLSGWLAHCRRWTFSWRPFPFHLEAQTLALCTGTPSSVVVVLICGSIDDFPLSLLGHAEGAALLRCHVSYSDPAW